PGSPPRSRLEDHRNGNGESSRRQVLKMKRDTTLAALVALALTPTACGTHSTPAANSAQPHTSVTLTLNWVPYGEHAPFYYGLKKGFYANEGIDLTIKSGTGSGNTIQQVAQQKTTFGW